MSAPRWLNPEEDRAWRAYQRMRTLLPPAISRDLARESGLSEPDYDVLSNLSETEARRWRLTDLAERMLWSSSRLSHHIGRMEARGLVRREQCASDGRGWFVVLTDDGMRAIEEAAPGHVESVRRHLIDLLSDDQVRALGDIGETVVKNLTGQAATAEPQQ